MGSGVRWAADGQEKEVSIVLARGGKSFARPQGRAADVLLVDRFIKTRYQM
jgi:hypothetical protein